MPGMNSLTSFTTLAGTRRPPPAYSYVLKRPALRFLPSISFSKVAILTRL
jgi:hypothetical protein